VTVNANDNSADRARLGCWRLAVTNFLGTRSRRGAAINTRGACLHTRAQAHLRLTQPPDKVRVYRYPLAVKNNHAAGKRTTFFFPAADTASFFVSNSRPESAMIVAYAVMLYHAALPRNCHVNQISDFSWNSFGRPLSAREISLQDVRGSNMSAFSLGDRLSRTSLRS
jgi:hypothetical protein